MFKRFYILIWALALGWAYIIYAADPNTPSIFIMLTPAIILAAAHWVVAPYFKD